MANDSNSRAPRYPFTRSNAPVETTARASGNDPLSELARLIGQNDPLAEAAPAAPRRDLRDILSGRRDADWPGSPPAPSPTNYGNPPPLVPDYRSDAPSDREPYASPHHGEALEDQPSEYGDPPPEYGHSQADGPYYGDDGQLLPEDHYTHEQYAFEEPPPRRRGGLFIVVAVLGFAIIGTAGAYAYRTLFSGGAPGIVPLIKAETTPNKIVPVQSGDGAANKQIYDRIGNGNAQGEKVVSREEQPVDVKAAAPRAAYPAPAAPSQGNAAPPGGQFPTAWPLPPGTAPSGVSGVQNEPRKVRTVTIRPDQPAAQSAPAARAAPTPTPDNDATPAARPQALRPAQPSSTAPLSLTPQGLQERPARSSAVVASPRAAAPAAAANGGYVVQVSAQKTEDEAQLSFRAMQAKYPVLSGRQLLIRKKDIAGKGTFYGAQVGPFASREDAAALCDELKSAGGSCMVQKN
jgi:hypothetical protein